MLCKMMRPPRLCFLYCCLVLVLLTGCEDKTSQEGGDVSPPIEQTQTSAEQFQNMSLKVKSTALLDDPGEEQSAIIELYVDAEGDGEGLLGFGDTVLNLIASNNKLFIVLDSTNIVCITDINARCYFADITASSLGDMQGVGFEFTDEFPTSFSSTRDTLTLKTVYASSDKTFETKRVIESISMSLREALQYSVDFLHPDVVDTPGDDETQAVESFYVDARYGITIEGKKYSVGDTCNTSTYFQELRPEGILYSNRYREDQKVTLTHVSYISSTGRTTFTVIDNYVQAIATTANFNFRGFRYGMSADDVRLGLAYNLSMREEEDVRPIDPSLIVDSFDNNTYYCHVGELNIEFRLIQAELQEIYITRPLGFK